MPPKIIGYLVLFVDDLTVGASPVVLDALEVQLADAFPMKFLGFPLIFTGINVTKLPGGALKLHQATYVNRMVALWGFGNSGVSKAPTSTERLSEVPATQEEKQLMMHKPYRNLVGVCLWLNLTCRKDIIFAVHQVGRRAADPKPQDMTAVKKIFRYLKGTPELGITFRRVDTQTHAGLVIYTDTDWAGHETRMSTFCFIIFCNGTPIFWRSGLFKTIALSSMEAELMGISEAAKAALHVIRVVEEFGFPINYPVTVWCDNKAAIQAIYRQSTTKRSRHIEVRHFWMRDHVNAGKFDVRYVESEENLADIGTKPLGPQRFVQLRDMIFSNVPEKAWKKV